MLKIPQSGVWWVRQFGCKLPVYCRGIQHPQSNPHDCWSPHFVQKNDDNIVTVAMAKMSVLHEEENEVKRQTGYNMIKRHALVMPQLWTRVYIYMYIYIYTYVYYIYMITHVYTFKHNNVNALCMCTFHTVIVVFVSILYIYIFIYQVAKLSNIRITVNCFQSTVSKSYVCAKTIANSPFNNWMMGKFTGLPLKNMSKNMFWDDLFPFTHPLNSEFTVLLVLK